MGPIGCPEASVRNYRYSLRNDTVERSSQLLRSRAAWSHANLPNRVIKNSCNFVLSSVWKISLEYAGGKFCWQWRRWVLFKVMIQCHGTMEGRT